MQYSSSSNCTGYSESYFQPAMYIQQNRNYEELSQSTNSTPITHFASDYVTMPPTSNNMWRNYKHNYPGNYINSNEYSNHNNYHAYGHINHATHQHYSNNVRKTWIPYNSTTPGAVVAVTAPGVHYQGGNMQYHYSK